MSLCRLSMVSGSRHHSGVLCRACLSSHQRNALEVESSAVVLGRILALPCWPYRMQWKIKSNALHWRSPPHIPCLTWNPPCHSYKTMGPRVNGSVKWEYGRKTPFKMSYPNPCFRGHLGANFFRSLHDSSRTGIMRLRTRVSGGSG